MIVPAPEATDFPPVKFKKIDLLCPKIMAIPTRGAKPEKRPNFTAIIFVIATGIMPLNPSSNIVAIKPFKPRTRFTFVAPVA